MNTKRMFCLICAAALSCAASLASASPHGGGAPMMSRSSGMRPAPRFAPRTMTGSHRSWFDGDHDRDDRFRRVVFIDDFGFPFFDPFFYSYYPYPYGYYGYYPYGYYGYNGYGYGSGGSVVELQRRLARTGYYRGRIDGIMGRQTRRALRAFQRDHGGSVRDY